MRVFVTGASGYIGSAVVRELLGAGHQVLGLARSDASASAVTAAGAAVQRGSLDDLDSLRAGAEAADGVIHLAFDHAGLHADFAAACQTDLRAIETMGAALEGSGKPFVVTSGTLLLALLGREGTEDDQQPGGFPRVASENTAVGLAQRGVRSSVVRLAPSVHGEADRGFVRILMNIARTKGVSAYVGDGSNRWPAVHRLDAACLFRLALEGAPAGARLHGAGESGIPFREIAAAIGRQLQLPVASIPPADAPEHFNLLGAAASAVGLDNPTSSELTRQRLDWCPNGPGLIADIEHGFYLTD